MATDIQLWIDGAWILLGLVWLALAFSSKQTVRKESGASRLRYAAVLVVGCILIFNPKLRFGFLGYRLLPATLAVLYCGLLLTVTGIAFSFWARFTIGRNWSGTVTLKQEHQLVTNGPYSIARHPIYSGILLALVGTAIAVGQLRAFVGVPIVLLGFYIKSRVEEQFMLDRFGVEYAQYRRRVKALIPFIL